MIEFELPGERPPAAPGPTSLLGSLILPSERAKYFWSGEPPPEGVGDTPPPLPIRAALAGPLPELADFTADSNLLRASGSDVAARKQDLQPAKPSWQRAAEAIEAVMAQRARSFPLDVASPSGPAYQEAQAKLTTAIAPAVGAGGTASVAGGGVAGLAARIAPMLAAAPVAAAALPLLLIPTNSQSGTIEFGGGLRARFAPGQRTATIERRVDNGLLGSGLGARWETLSVAATVGAGPDGRQTVFADRGQLERAIGAVAAAAPLKKAGVAGPPQQSGVPLPLIMEIRIGSSTDRGVTTIYREATRDEILEVCPNYAEYERIALRAAENARAAGLPNGLAHGNRVHREAEAEVRKIAQVQKQLEARGVRHLHSEFALRDRVGWSYHRPKGSSVLDVLEIHQRKTVCVYDFKTGNASFPDDRIRRYAKEVGLFVRALPYGYTHIYVVPIRVP